MSDLIVYVDRSTVHEGRLAELKAAMSDLADFVEANEPEILSYNVYFDDAGTQMSVVHTHANSESLAFHMDVAGPKFPPIGEFMELVSIDVYGRPSDGLVQELQQKASTLGRGSVSVHDRHDGFSRLSDADPR